MKSKRSSKGYPYIGGQLLGADALIPHIQSGEVTRARRMILKPNPRTASIRQSRNPAMPEYWLAYDERKRVLNGFQCLYGAPGQFLRLRESFAITKQNDDGTVTSTRTTPPDGLPAGSTLHYRADAQHSPDPGERGFDWRPAIWMPAWATRTLLEVKAIRALRVQDPPESPDGYEQLGGTIKVFEDLWDCASRSERLRVGNHKVTDAFRWDKGTPAQLWQWSWELYQGAMGWDTNPWCWEIEFKAHPVESVHAL